MRRAESLVIVIEGEDPGPRRAGIRLAAIERGLNLEQAGKAGGALEIAPEPK
jgi:hypothetical protein